MQLQNGSDIRGIAIDGVKNEEVNLTPEIAGRIGAAFGEILSEKLGKKVTIALGRDSRISGEMLLSAVAMGIQASGNKVLDFGLASTPAMFMAIKDETLTVDGSVMITASHLPFNRNGMKFFMDSGGADKGFVKEILMKAESMNSIQLELPMKPIQRIEYLKRYAAGLRKVIQDATGEKMPLMGTKIIVDAGNGAGGFFAREFLDRLGADTEGSLFLQPNGMFPNHVPNPEDKEALKAIQDKVLSTGADLGIIFDTDVDRAALIDSDGKAINRNRLIALISTVILKEHPRTHIVTDSVTSVGLGEFIDKRGGFHHRFKRGYKNVIDEGLKLNNMGKPCWLAIETSGHGALKENFFLDDGAYLVVKLLTEFATMKKKGKKLTDLINDLVEPVSEEETRIRIEDPQFSEYGQKVLDDLRQFVESKSEWYLEEPNHEGVRVNCLYGERRGWFLVRMSLHDPVLPINFEADFAEGCQRMKRELMAYLSRYEKLAI